MRGCQFGNPPERFYGIELWRGPGQEVDLDFIAVLFGPLECALVVGYSIDDQMDFPALIVAYELLQETNECLCVEVLRCKLEVELGVFAVNSHRSEHSKRLPPGVAQHEDSRADRSPCVTDRAVLREENLIFE